MKIVDYIINWFHKDEKYLCIKPCCNKRIYWNRYDIIKYTNHIYDHNCILTGNYLILNYIQMKKYVNYMKEQNIKLLTLGV